MTNSCRCLMKPQNAKALNQWKEALGSLERYTEGVFVVTKLYQEQRIFYLRAIQFSCLFRGDSEIADKEIDDSGP